MKKKKNKAPCITEPATVSSPQLPSISDGTDQTTTNSHKERTMDLEMKLSQNARKDDRLVIFNFADGRPGQVQFLKTAFPKDAIPDTITLSGEFAEFTGKVTHVAETKEERKARLKALPKLTLAEKVAKAEERTDKLRRKLAATSVVSEASAGM